MIVSWAHTCWDIWRVFRVAVAPPGPTGTLRTLAPVVTLKHTIVTGCSGAWHPAGRSPYMLDGCTVDDASESRSFLSRTLMVIPGPC